MKFVWTLEKEGQNENDEQNDEAQDNDKGHAVSLAR